MGRDGPTEIYHADNRYLAIRESRGSRVYLDTFARRYLAWEVEKRLGFGVSV